jgi:protein-glucosylgalactosylhydroxylysine glucosidase
MGLSGTGYNGHIFWDMDLWMFPALLVMNPAMAKSLVNYRYERLGAAMHHARLNGYKGAMYPW